MRPLALALVVLIGGCGARTEQAAPAAPPPPAGPPRLLVVSSLIGYIEPCGCTVDLLLGGIDRMAAVVAAERAQGPTAVLVVGPHLFGHDVPDDRVPQEEAKARLLVESLGTIGVDAVLPSPAELTRGRAFYEGLGIGWPDVTANVTGGAGRVLALGDLQVGVFGLAPPEVEVPRGRTTDPAAAAAHEAARLRAAGAHVVVALGDLPRRDLRDLAGEVKGVDLWVLGDHPDEKSVASPAGEAFIVEAGDRGRNLGRVLLLDAAAAGPLRDPAGEAERARKSLELQIGMRKEMLARTGDQALAGAVADLEQQLAALAAPATSGKRFEYALLPITKEVTPDPGIAQAVAAYNAALKDINLAAAGEVPPVPEGQSGYAGGHVCTDCHDEADHVWMDTPHSRAWRTLEKANKTFDAECVSCHVTGWREPGGTVLGKLGHLKDVQCESCHGPSAKHAEDGDPKWTKREAPAEVCVTCHNAHHSPKFDYATYLPKILGPGHEQKKPAATPGP